MKLKYLSLTAALFAGLFTACDDSGANATDGIASYNTLPKFCEEGDTIKLASKSELFYCNNGDWLEVGLIINTEKSSSSTAETPKSSETKEEDSKSSESSGEIESDSGETTSSSSACTGHRCKTEGSSDSNSSGSGKSSDSGTSANSGNSSSSGNNSSGSTTVESSSDRDPLFMWMDTYVTWKKDDPTFDDGDRSETTGIVKTRYNDNEFTFAAKVTGFKDIDLSVLTTSNIDQLGATIGLTTPALSEYRKLFVKTVFDDEGDMYNYFVAGPTDPIVSIYRYVEIGIYKGNIEDLIDALVATEEVCGDMWCGPEAEYRVMTGLDAHEEGYKNGTSGYWFIFKDNADGGNSDVYWPVDPGTEYSADALDPVIDHCEGLCGIADLVTGTLSYSPFAGVGFAVAGAASTVSPTPVAADASSWGGVCVVYTSDADIRVELGLSDAKEKDLKFDIPNHTIAKSADQKVVNISWSAFVQDGWGASIGAESITGDAAAKELVYLKFKIQNDPGYYEFNIISVGTYGSCKAIN